MYDYLIVGAGLFGSVFAHEAARAGKKVHSLLHLTDSLIHLLRIIRASCIHCHSICIPSIRCGVL